MLLPRSWPVLLRYPGDLGRSRPESPASQNTGVIGLGAAGELAQGDATAEQEPERKWQRTEPWHWFERGQQRQPWPGDEKSNSANRWRRERSRPNRKV